MDERLRDRLRLAAAGALQGLAFWFLVEEWPDGQLARTAAVALFTFLGVAGVVFHFARTGEAPRRLLALMLGTGLVYAAVAGWVGWSMPTEEHIRPSADDRGWIWFWTTLITLYVLGPFLQGIQSTGRLQFPYRDLFLRAWNNLFVAGVGWAFVLALWIVLLLWGALFNLIDIDFFEELFEEELFMWTVSGAALGFGVALGRESERVVSTLRGATLAAFRGLLPLVCAVALLFLGSLPFTGLEPLWATDHASQLLLTWVALTLVLLNAVYQDGAGDPPRPAAHRWLVEAGLLAMVVFAGIAAYGISLRIEQYGLTPRRMWVVLFTIVLGAHALGYAQAVLRRGDPWLRTLQGVNVCAALLVVAVGLAVHTPLLDPVGWSTRSQVGRLLDGRAPAAEFDYGYLRFELGNPGIAAFEGLAALESHGSLAVIQENVALARTAQNYYEWGQLQSASLHLDDLEVLPPGTELPANLAAALLSGAFPWHADACKTAPLCAIFPAELDGAPPVEWVMVFDYSSWLNIRVFRDRGGHFENLGGLSSAEKAVPGVLARALREGRFREVEARYRDLEIGGTLFSFGPTPAVVVD